MKPDRLELGYLFSHSYFWFRYDWERGCAHADGDDLRRSDLLGLYIGGGEL